MLITPALKGPIGETPVVAAIQVVTAFGKLWLCQELNSKYFTKVIPTAVKRDGMPLSTATGMNLTNIILGQGTRKKSNQTI